MKVSVLNQLHPAHPGKRLEYLGALFDGGPRWRRHLDHWLPKRPQEPAEVYRDRKGAATYTNHVGGLVALLSALLFSESPKVSGVEGGYWTALQRDCDRGGSRWSEFWQARLTDAQVGGCAWVWVNLPARAADAPLPASRADEEAAGGLNAWLVGLGAEQVLDWGEDEAGRPQWLLFRTVSSERAGPTTPRKTVWRWTYLDGTTIRRWEWRPSDPKQPTPGDEDEATELPSIAHGMGRLPVVRLMLPSELWTMGRLEEAAVAALRARNAHTWALHQAANELLVIKSVWQDEKVDLGHGHYLRLTRDQHGEDNASYVGPSGVAFEFLQQDVQDTREELYRVVHQMAQAADSDAQQADQSGASKQQDWKALEVILGRFRVLMLDAMGAALELLVALRGERAEVAISGLEGWQNEDLGAFLAAAGLAVDARQMSSSFRKAVARRQAERLLQDEVTPEELEQIRREITEAPDDPAPYIPPQG